MWEATKDFVHVHEHEHVSRPRDYFASRYALEKENVNRDRSSTRWTPRKQHVHVHVLVLDISLVHVLVLEIPSFTYSFSCYRPSCNAMRSADPRSVQYASVTCPRSACPCAMPAR